MNGNESPRLEHWLGLILGWGTATSTVLLGAGLLMEMFHTGGGVAPALANAGLVILMATPLARVAVSVGEYTRERDWLFAVLTGLVLTILVSSLLVGLRG